MKDFSTLIIASNFPPIQSAGVYRTLRIVKYLPAYDWQLSVLTLSTSTLSEGTKLDQNLLDKVSSNISVYRAPARFPIQTINRITGRRSRERNGKPSTSTNVKAGVNGSSSSAQTKSWFQQIKDRVSLPWMTPDRLVGWVGPAAKLGMKAIRKEGPDVIYSSGPAWSNHLVAKRLVEATVIPWVADFRDPWVGNAFRKNRSEDSWVGRKHQQLELGVYQTANVVIFNTDRARQDAVKRVGVWLADKSTVIPNGFDPEDFEGLKPITSSFSGNDDSTRPLRMAHAGSFYGKRNVDSLLQAVGELKQSGDLSPCDFQIELIGSLRAHEKSLVEQHEIQDMVTFVPSLPHRKCLERLNTADILLLVQTDAPLCVPGKLYEYIALNKPIYTFSGEGATVDLVTKERLGVCIDPSNISRIKYSITDLVRQHREGILTAPDDSIAHKYDGHKQMELFDAAFRRAMDSNCQIRRHHEESV